MTAVLQSFARHAESRHPDATPSVWLLDVDGTVALRRADGRGPYDYDRVLEDEPNSPVVRVVQALALTGDQFIAISGRLDIDDCKTDTMHWLREHVFDPVDPRLDPLLALHLRPRDMKAVPDDELKRALYYRYIYRRYRVHGVFDNRAKVVAVWRELGLTCFDVEGGDF